jgi:hypothetical protein
LSHSSSGNRKTLFNSSKALIKQEKPKEGTQESITINVNSREKYRDKKSSSPRALFKKF